MPLPNAQPGSRDGKRPLRVLVAGYGPVGRCVVEELGRVGVAVTIIDLNQDTIAQQQRLKLHHAVHGDVTAVATLKQANIQAADALVIAVPAEAVAVEACRVARRLAPNIFIAVRTNFLSKGMQASTVGADEVIVEEVVTARAMRDAVIGRLAPPGAGDNRSQQTDPAP